MLNAHPGRGARCALRLTLPLLLLTGCLTPAAWTAERRSPPSMPPAAITVSGDPLPGLTDEELERFESGKLAFEFNLAVEDGLGPVFNHTSCAACHGGPATGGGSLVFSTRIGTRTDGRFDPLIRLGGPVIQNAGIVGLDNVAIPAEIVPAEATIVARRRTTATFGYGLVDAVPDGLLHLLVLKQWLTSPATAGRVNLVTDLRTGNEVAGKFGWKAASPNLLNFSGDAYKEEMGITTQGWLPDADGRLIDDENPPQGDASWLEFNPVGSPNFPDIEHVISFTDFMTFLAPPPRGPVNDRVPAGERVFSSIGCANCHQPQLITGPNDSAALNFRVFSPYSDFLLHDMGSLGDGIEQGIARGSEMRTAPLWGLRDQPAFLHDGRSPTIEDAILQHRGQGQRARDRFRQLNDRDRAALLEFLKSL